MANADVIRAEVADKVRKVQTVALMRGLAGILLTQQWNLCWLTAGGNNHVLWDTQDSLMAILVTPLSAYVLAANSDHDRVRDEEFGPYPFEYVKAPWYSYDPLQDARRIAGDGRLGVDGCPAGDRVNIDGELMQYRAVLVPSEVERVRQYGRQAAEVMTRAAFRTRAGIRETEIAGALAHEATVSGFNIAVILVGADERSLKYRHLTPIDAPVRKQYSFCGALKKGGLTFPMNREVSFGAPDDFLAEKNDRVETVYVYMDSLARPGVTLGELCNRLPEAYASVGESLLEWENHSQGGITAYKPREAVVAPGASYMLRENNVVGWNVSLPGVMAEDLSLLTGVGIEPITSDPAWPARALTANGHTETRPSILVL